jgi:hypothetical protein
MTDLETLRTEWQQFVAKKLGKHTAALTAVLRTMVAQSYPDEVVSIDFEIFPDGFTNRFPARAFFMDEHSSEYFLFDGGKAKYPGFVDPSIIKVDRIYSLDDEDQFLARDGADELDDELWDLSVASFMRWFETCWIDAGGRKFERRAIIMPHDDYSRMCVLPTSAGAD